jgi:hypothetical protein
MVFLGNFEMQNGIHTDFRSQLLSLKCHLIYPNGIFEYTLHCGLSSTTQFACFVSKGNLVIPRLKIRAFSSVFAMVCHVHGTSWVFHPN